MGVKDPVKNREYVAKHRAKKREAIGSIEYKKEQAQEMRNYRTSLKIENAEEYLKNNATYMREYRARKKLEDDKKKAINTLTDAIRARKARAELAKLKTDKETKVVKRRRGRPVGSKNKKQQEEFKMELRPRPKKS